MKKLFTFFQIIPLYYSILINGFYRIEDNQLRVNFVFFYGSRNFGFESFRSSINFYYDKTIIVSK